MVKSKGFAHLVALGLVSMILHYVIVNTVALVAALERQDLSRTYPAHHELESVVILLVVINAAWHAKLRTKQTYVTP